MVSDLFASQQRPGRRSGAGGGADRALFAAVVEQVQTNLASSVQTPSSMRTIASYFTRRVPEIDGRPFCVALADCTFLYHMQMARVPKTDVDLYAQLVSDVVSQLPVSEHHVHPFMTQVVRDRLLGVPSPTSTKAHSVVLLPPHLFIAWDHLVTTLVLHNAVPEDWIALWHRQLEIFSQAASPMASHRATALLVRTAHHVTQEEQIRELHAVLRAKKNTLNIDLILTCYERLKRICPDVERGTVQHRALAIHCSEIFLKFRSPIRKDYVERFLYPALCSEDMRAAVYFPSTREHLTRRLLRQCVPSMSTTNAFYMCICAVMHREMSNEVSASLEVLRLMRCQMPHAAYFLGTLATDPNMSLSTFAKSMMVLTRASAFALTGRSAGGDDVARAMDNNPMDVYNVLFSLREIVRHCSCGTTKRSDEMLAATKRAIPEKTIDALGKLTTEAFDGRCEVVLEPSLLCAELGMVIHDLNVEEGVDASLMYLTEACQLCTHCAGPKSASAVCPVQGIAHLENATAARRLLSTIAECAGNKALERKLIALFREPDAQHNASLHQLTYHILTHAGQHRLALFRALEPYIRNTLVTVLTADQSTLDYDNTGALSLVKANIMHLNVKLAVLMASVIDATYVKAILKIFADMQLRSNHDGLTVWYLCNFMLRNGRANVELMPLDPQECNYGDGFPACAPANHVSADNGQMLLELLDRVLHSSPEMTKMRGCTVCRLIQDFSVQSANIVSRLLGPCGFVPIGMPELHRMGIPVGSESTFWAFVVKQMRSSAPTRTALIATLARSIAMRFRIQSPAEAVAVEGGESTGHVFAVMMYEAMRRNATLSRTVLHMMTTWVRQKKNMMPGKYTCLVYCCIQLATAVMLRHEFTDEMEAAAEPASDRHIFDEVVMHATECIAAQLPRVEKLLPEVSHNPPFCFLLKKIHLRARLLISEVQQQPVRPSAFDDEVNEAARRSIGDSLPLAHTVDIRDLQNADDDEVFSNMGGDDNWNDNNDDAMGDDDEDWYPSKAGEKRHYITQQGECDEGAAGLSADDEGMNNESDGEKNSQGHNNYRSVHSQHHHRQQDTKGSNTLLVSSHHNSKPRGILVNRSANSSVGPSVSMRPPHTGGLGNSRGASAKSTQTAREVATNTSFSSDEKAMTADPHPQGLSPAEDPAVRVATGTSHKRSGQYFFKNTPLHPSHVQQQAQSRQKPPLQPRGRSGASSSGASSTFLRRAPPQEELDEEYPEAHYGPQLHPPQYVVHVHHPQAQQPSFVLPSNVALQLLAQQGADSLLGDLTYTEAARRTQHFLEEQAAHFPMGGIQSNANRYHAPHQAYVPPPQHAMAHVTMEPRTNNYAEPHDNRAPQPQTTVVAHLTMQETNSRPGSRSRDETFGGPQHNQHGREEQQNSSKRRRMEHDDRPLMPSLQGGNQTVTMPVETARRLRELQFSRGPSSTHTGAEAEYEDEPARATPHPNQIGFDLVTPHATRAIPQALVEQQADSTLRELGMAAGGRANVVMGGSSAKRRFTSQMFDGAENDSQWYTLTAQAPMPSYASDSRYNMEIM